MSKAKIETRGRPALPDGTARKYRIGMRLLASTGDKLEDMCRKWGMTKTEVIEYLIDKQRV